MRSSPSSATVCSSRGSARRVGVNRRGWSARSACSPSARLGIVSADVLQIAEVVGQLVLACRRRRPGTGSRSRRRRAAPRSERSRRGCRSRGRTTARTDPGRCDRSPPSVIERAARVAAVDARLADLDLLAAGRVVDRELLVLRAPPRSVSTCTTRCANVRDSPLRWTRTTRRSSSTTAGSRRRRRPGLGRHQRPRVGGVAPRRARPAASDRRAPRHQPIDVALELRVLGPQRQRRPQPLQRLGVVAQPVRAACPAPPASPDRRAAGATRRLERRQRALPIRRRSRRPRTAAPARSSSDGRSGRNAAAAASRARGVGHVAPGRAPARQLVEKIDVEPAAPAPARPARDRPARAGRPPRRDAPPPDGPAAAPDRRGQFSRRTSAASGSPASASSSASAKRRRPAGRIDRQRLAPAFGRPRFAPLASGQLRQAGRPAAPASPAVTGRAAQGPARGPPAFVVVARDVGRPQQRGQRGAARADARVERGAPRPALGAVARRQPGQRTARGSSQASRRRPTPDLASAQQQRVQRVDARGGPPPGAPNRDRAGGQRRRVLEPEAAPRTARSAGRRVARRHR